MSARRRRSHREQGHLEFTSGTAISGSSFGDGSGSGWGDGPGIDLYGHGSRSGGGAGDGSGLGLGVGNDIATAHALQEAAAELASEIEFVLDAR
jgi:hypothetical protein